MTEQRHARRFKHVRRFKHTISWRGSTYDLERIQVVFRRYRVPWGISRSARFRVLFRLLAAAEKH